MPKSLLRPLDQQALVSALQALRQHFADNGEWEQKLRYAHGAVTMAMQSSATDENIMRTMTRYIKDVLEASIQAARPKSSDVLPASGEMLGHLGTVYRWSEQMIAKRISPKGEKTEIKRKSGVLGKNLQSKMVVAASPDITIGTTNRHLSTADALHHWETSKEDTDKSVH